MAGRQSNLRLDLTVQEFIGDVILAGASMKEIAQLYRCHPVTVHWYRANIELYGVVTPPPSSVQSRP
jgi:DNA-binding CsgD family transcriptional regulator